MGFKKGQSKTKNQTNNKQSGVSVSKQDNVPAKCQTLDKIASAWNKVPNRKPYCQYAMAIALGESWAAEPGCSRNDIPWPKQYPDTGYYNSEAVAPNGTAKGIWQTDRAITGSTDQAVEAQATVAYEYMNSCTDYIKTYSDTTMMIPFDKAPQRNQDPSGPIFCGGINCDGGVNTCLGWNHTGGPSAYQEKVGTGANFTPSWSDIETACNKN